jgi:hypothetical protein
MMNIIRYIGNLYDNMDMNRAWEIIRENIKISAKESLDYDKLNSISHGLMKDVQSSQIKGNKPNCRGYRSQPNKLG